MLVDPIKKTKTPLFDHAKMAAALTMITRIPYDAQHLPFTQVRFIKNDTAFEFEVQVPRDAVIPTTKPKAITTDQQGGRAAVGTSRRTNSTWSRIRCSRAAAAASSSSKVRAAADGCRSGPGHGGAAHEDAALRVRHGDRKDDAGRGLSRGAAPSSVGLLSPDGKTILFARNHNLFMMDAANCEKAKKTANDKTIVEHQLTTDGVEHYSFGGGGRGGGGQQEQQQEQDRPAGAEPDQQEEQGRGRQERPRTRRQRGVVADSRSSRSFAAIRAR